MTFLAIRKIIVAKTKIEKDNSNNVNFLTISQKCLDFGIILLNNFQSLGNPFLKSFIVEF